MPDKTPTGSLSGAFALPALHKRYKEDIQLKKARQPLITILGGKMWECGWLREHLRAGLGEANVGARVGKLAPNAAGASPADVR